jgi:ketosteroid isomerase-like protein
VTEDEQALWQAVQRVYAGFLAGDREAVDANISPSATIWDSSHEPLLNGKSELDALREARPAAGPTPLDLQATDPVITVWGDIGLVRHVLLVQFADGVERIRNTSVWRRDKGRWLCVHNHEDTVDRPSR